MMGVSGRAKLQKGRQASGINRYKRYTKAMGGRCALDAVQRSAEHMNSRQSRSAMPARGLSSQGAPEAGERVRGARAPAGPVVLTRR